MASKDRTPFENPLVEWVDSRLPIFTMVQKEYGVFPTPRNFNYFWNFGAIAMFMLVAMIVTGIFLAMQYTPNAAMAFDSVERITRDVNGGWLMRYIHMNGASFFFIAVYIHILRGIYYGSYKKPRELLWILGVVIFIIMMATAFMGYVLPWGQMSYWGATVITQLFSAIPIIGDHIVTWMWGGFSVDNPTLNRFFALHYLLPFVIFAVVFLHIWALHVVGSNNPLGIDVKDKQDTLPFHPYYTIKDTFGLIVYLLIFSFFVFFAPDSLGHPDNYIPANPLVTPEHIVPEWYFLPFYAILRSITFGVNPYIGISGLLGVAALFPLYRKKFNGLDSKFIGLLVGAGIFFVLGYLSQFEKESGGALLPLPFADLIFINAKLLGVIFMFGALLMWLIMPWLDWHPVRSARFRPYFRVSVWVLVVAFAFLGYIGSHPAAATLLGLPLSVFGVACALYYYGFFLGLLPYLSRFEKGQKLPPSIYTSVMTPEAAE